MDQLDLLYALVTCLELHFLGNQHAIPLVCCEASKGPSAPHVYLCKIWNWAAVKLANHFFQKV